MRGIVLELADPKSLGELLDRGERDRELGPCEQACVKDGRWLTATVRVGDLDTVVPVCARDFGDGERLTLSERDWQRLRRFARHCEESTSAAERPSGVTRISRGGLVVVSAEACVRTVVAATLRCANYNAVVASSAEEALGLVARRTIDLAIIDGQLPDAPTAALCQRLRQSSRGGSLAMIGLVGASAATEVAESARFGLDDYVIAPFRREELLARIDSQLHRVAQDWVGAA